MSEGEICGLTESAYHGLQYNVVRGTVSVSVLEEMMEAETAISAVSVRYMNYMPGNFVDMALVSDGKIVGSKSLPTDYIQ